MGTVSQARKSALADWFSALGRPLQLFVALSLMLAVAALDYQTGYELAFSIFYLGPIALVSWFVGRKPGIAMSLFGAFLWWGAEALEEHPYSNPNVIYWNTLVRLGFFLIVNHLLGRIRLELSRVRELSQRDHLTGAVNRRYFSELAETELARMVRNGRALTLVYIDLDNFKKANDTLGHETGDRILTSVVKILTANLRRPDVVARIGGDEFLVLMPETDLEQAETVVKRQLEICGEEIRSQGWPIGLSIGAVSCAKSCTLDELIKAADTEMYNAKQSGKNRACFRTL